MARDIDERETAEQGPEDLTRLVEALHPSKEEDERAERFAARLLESPAAVTAAGPAVAATEAPAQAAPASPSASAPRTWQRDVVVAAIGIAIGVVGTLVVTSLT